MTKPIVKPATLRGQSVSACAMIEQDCVPENVRPWGHYESLAIGPRFQVKSIVVVPGGRLSLQSHYHRSEHWIIVAGSALVTKGSGTKLLSENDSIYIPVGTIHRLENPGRVTMQMIEVQTGTYFGEDDIIRFDDEYGRT